MEQTGHTSACEAQLSPPPPGVQTTELPPLADSNLGFRWRRLRHARALTNLIPLDFNRGGTLIDSQVGIGVDDGFGSVFGPIMTPSTTPTRTPGLTQSNSWHEEPRTPNETKWVSCGNFSSPKDYSHVVCTPQPNAFNPCEDVMGYSWLRVLVWFVLLAALCGNLLVIVVLLTARSKLTVPKFLMCNLSFADLLMGLYLLLIACADAHSLGEYFTNAVSWQNDGGCQVAGFLTVFASELSVFVLTIITLERWYAISQAIHVNKRLRMRQAVILLFVGWAYASTMAILPLFGVSGYGAVSMCLPMEAKEAVDIVYITTLLIFNGIAFVAICCCYISMFLQVRASESMARSNDATIAKRMAILVLTNFICWAPIAFFGLTASFGLPLIDITNSKILLVFFYPFNSCANPFLYVILTKQFRKDVFILLGRHGMCTARANKYKGSSVALSYSKNNGMMINTGRHHASDVSMLSQYRKGSKASVLNLNGSSPMSPSKGSFPKMAPQDMYQESPNESPHASESPNKEMSQRQFSFTIAPEAPKPSKLERKLSTVIETSHTSDGPSEDGNSCHITSIAGPNDERVLEGRDSLRDLFEGSPHGRVRSASEYVVIFKASSTTPQNMASQQQQQQQQHQSQQGCTRSRRRDEIERQPSRDTMLSSQTLSSFLSDSSSSRLDSDSDTRLSDRKYSQTSTQIGSYLDNRRDSTLSDLYYSDNNYETKMRKQRSMTPQSPDEADALITRSGSGSCPKRNGAFDRTDPLHKFRHLSSNRRSVDSIDEVDGEDVSWAECGEAAASPSVKRTVPSVPASSELGGHGADAGGKYSSDEDDVNFNDNSAVCQALLHPM